jgi:hypothetical protein
MAFFSQSYSEFREALIPGTAVYVLANLKLDGQDTYRLMAKSMEPLDTKVKMADVTLDLPHHINLAHLKQVVSDLKPGRTRLNFLVVVSGIGTVRISLKDTFTITPNSKAALMQVIG